MSFLLELNNMNSEDTKKQIKSKIREIPDWPKQGINFKDITPLLQDGELFQEVINELARPYQNKKIDKIVGIDARGFLLSSALAYKLGSGIVIARKKGKLPSDKISREYSLEYGTNSIEMHKDAILPDEKVLIVDDLLATGGTMKAAVDLVEKLRGDILAINFLIELDYLKGRKKLKGHRIDSLIHFKS